MAYEIQNWKSGLSEQRRLDTGCIPWCFEWMLRLSETAVDYATFQDEFDLQSLGIAANDFGSVSTAIMRRYPAITIRSQGFAKGDGANKIARVEELIQQGVTCAFALTFPPQGKLIPVHIMPVVQCDDSVIRLVHSYDAATQRAAVIILPRDAAAQIHDTMPGGKDIAWLEQPQGRAVLR